MNTIALVGRRAELSEVRRLLHEAQAGVGSCLVIDGPAGIGKTRLLAEAMSDARQAGLAVVSGRFTELDRAAPLAALLTALHDHVEIAKLDLMADNRYWLLNRLGELIEAAARDRPIVIVLDDVQWADELTVLALRILVPALHTSPVSWLLALRSLPRRSPVRDAIRWIGTEHGKQLHLGPLDEHEVAEACRKLIGGVPSRELIQLAQRSGGNPFLLEELLSNLKTSNRVRIHRGRASLVDGDLPSGFIAAVQSRLQEMSPQIRALLDAGAVLGRPFSVHEAASLLGRPVAEVVITAADAVAAYALIETGTDLMFRHDLIREATYRALPGPARQALHREAVTVVRAEGRPAVEAAQHLIRVARKGDNHAIALIYKAATDLLTSAPGAAADLLLHLLELLDDNHPQRPARIVEAVRMLAAAGRLGQAQALGETALGSELDVAAEAGILAGLAEICKHAGQDKAVVQYANRALSLSGVPEALRAQLLAVKAHGLLYLDDIAGAELAAQKAMTVGHEASDASAVVYGAEARSVVARMRGHLGASTDLATLAVDLADSTDGEARLRLPKLWLGRALVILDRLDEAEGVFDFGQREAEQLGTAWSMPLWHHSRAHLRLASGRLDDAIAEAEAGLLVSSQLSANALDTSLLATLAWLAIRQGRVAEAHALLRRTRQTASNDQQRQGWRWALLHDARGNRAEALSVLTGLFNQLEERPGLLTFEPWSAPYLVRLAKGGGAAAQATIAATAARQLAQLNPNVMFLAGAAAHAEGVLHANADTLDEAITILRKGSRRLALASALEDKANLDRQAGRNAEAIAMFDEALTQYTGSLAHGDATRVNRHLRELGVRRRARTTSMRHLTGWASLTQSELKVVRLVAEGRTNRAAAAELFLSPHTVDSHLRHAFAKLSVTSRVELARRVLTEEAALSQMDNHETT